MPSDSSENEFEDAVDTLAPLPSTPLNQPRPSDSNTPLNTGHHALKLDLSAQSSRRNRLATLRNRMQTEFAGAPSIVGTDDDATQSEKTSLASWGRNFLMERNNDAAVIAVCPADSLSTKATNFSFNSNSFFNQSSIPGSISDTPSRNLNDHVGNTISAAPVTPLSRDNISLPIVPPSPKCFSPSSPPPNKPPPPLPERPPPAIGVSKASPAPPPLPPRKTSSKVTKAVAAEQLSPTLTDFDKYVFGYFLF